MRPLRESVRRCRPELWREQNRLLHHDDAVSHASIFTHRIPLIWHPVTSSYFQKWNWSWKDAGLITLRRSGPSSRWCLTHRQERTSRKRSKNGYSGTSVYMREGTTSRVMAADRPYGEFYDFTASVRNTLDRPSYIWNRLCFSVTSYAQGRPLGGASGALAPGADFEGAPKRRSPTGHTLIRSTVVWLFPHLQTKRVAKEFFLKNLVVLALVYSDVFWCLHMYIQVMLYVYCCKYCWLPPYTSRRAM
jgi:hypothetical protein